MVMLCMERKNLPKLHKRAYNYSFGRNILVMENYRERLNAAIGT
jgi:hypothetical protein